MQLIAIVLAAGLLAQAPSLPDLNGTWKMDAARSGSPDQTPARRRLRMKRETGGPTQVWHREFHCRDQWNEEIGRAQREDDPGPEPASLHLSHLSERVRNQM